MPYVFLGPCCFPSRRLYYSKCAGFFYMSDLMQINVHLNPHSWHVCMADVTGHTVVSNLWQSKASSDSSSVNSNSLTAVPLITLVISGRDVMQELLADRMTIYCRLKLFCENSLKWLHPKIFCLPSTILLSVAPYTFIAQRMQVNTYCLGLFWPFWLLNSFPLFYSFDNSANEMTEMDFGTGALTTIIYCLLSKSGHKSNWFINPTKAQTLAGDCL